MRILHVTREIGSDRRYGIGRSLAPVVQALQERGHEVRYLTQDDQSPRGRAWQQRWTERLAPWARRVYGAQAECFASIWLERLNMGRLAAKVASSARADVVHLHDPWIGWGFRLARHVHGVASCRWGITQHGFGCYTDAIREEGVPYTARLLRQHRRLEAGVLTAADWVICPTRSARAQLARDLCQVAVPAHWHAVPHPQPIAPRLSQEEARRQLGWTGDACRVVAVGRLNPVKRFDQLVRAVVALAEQTGEGGTCQQIQLTILGEGDPRSLHEIAALAKVGAVSLDVRTVDDVWPYLRGADVYVSCTANESFGLANLEAQAAGAPVLCTAVGGVPEVTGGGAWLVPGDDAALVPAVANALGTLLSNASQRKRMGEVGRAHAQSWPDASEVARQLEAVYASGG